NLKPCSSRFRSGARIGSPAAILLAAGALALGLGSGLHATGRIRETGAQFGVGRARRILLTQAIERHRELQQAVGGLGTLGVALIALEKRARSSLVLAAHEQGFTEPILGIAGECVVGIALHEVVERGFGGPVILLQQVAVRG